MSIVSQWVVSRASRRVACVRGRPLLRAPVLGLMPLPPARPCGMGERGVLGGVSVAVRGWCEGVARLLSDGTVVGARCEGECCVSGTVGAARGVECRRVAPAVSGPTRMRIVSSPALPECPGGQHYVSIPTPCTGASTAD